MFRSKSVGSGLLFLLIAGAVGLGPVLLCSLGAAQWVVLRRHVPGAGHWVWMSAAAWLAGLTVVMASAEVRPPFRNPIAP